MSIVKVTIREIATMARSTETPIHAPDFAHSGRYFLTDGDGTRIEYSAMKPPFGRQLASTYDLAKHAAIRAVDPHLANQYTAAKAYAAYVGPTEIRVAYVPESHGYPEYYDLVKLELHPVFRELEHIGRNCDGAEFSHKQLIKFLRARLEGFVPEETIQQFRRLKLAADETRTSAVDKNRDAVGLKIAKQIEQETGTSIPEEIIANVPVYGLPELVGDEAALCEIKLLVDVTTGDDGNAEFTLTVVTDTLRQARQDTTEYLVDRLRDHLDDAGLATLPIFEVQD